MTRTLVLSAILAFLAACSGAPGVDTQRTEAERDSLIGESALPGARGVKSARRAADAAESRSAALDSLTR